MTEQDLQYLNAIERNDQETVHKMVTEAAKEAGYQIGPVWHGTDRQFQSFRPAPEKIRTHVLPFGFHFSTDVERAEIYGDRIIAAYLKTKNLYDATGAPDQIAREIAGRKYNEGKMTAAQALDAGGDAAWGMTYAEQQLKRYRFDGVRYLDNQGVETYIVFDPHQVKLADPVVFDDNQNIIPLSARFPAYSIDMRGEIQPEGQPQGIEATTGYNIQSQQQEVEIE